MTSPALRLVARTPESGPLPLGPVALKGGRDPRSAAFVLALIAASPVNERLAVCDFARRLSTQRICRCGSYVLKATTNL